MRRLAIMSLTLLAAACAQHAAEAPVGAPQKFVVFFQEWSANMDDSAQRSVAAAAGWAREYPGAAVMVTGYAAPDGSKDANDALSKTRAQVVVDRLVADGVPQQRISIAAKGPTDFTLAAIESRRVEIAIAGP